VTDPANGAPPDSPPNPEPAASQTGTTDTPVNQGVEHEAPSVSTPATPAPAHDQNSIDGLMSRLTTELSAMPERVASSVRQALDALPAPKVDAPAEPSKAEAQPGGTGDSGNDGKSWLSRMWFG